MNCFIFRNGKRELHASPWDVAGKEVDSREEACKKLGFVQYDENYLMTVMVATDDAAEKYGFQFWVDLNVCEQCYDLLAEPISDYVELLRFISPLIQEFRLGVIEESVENIKKYLEFLPDIKEGRIQEYRKQKEEGRRRQR